MNFCQSCKNGWPVYEKHFKDAGWPQSKILVHWMRMTEEDRIQSALKITRRHKSQKAKRPSAYSVFLSEKSKGIKWSPDALRSLIDEWRALDQESKEPYELKAQQLHQDARTKWQALPRNARSEVRRERKVIQCAESKRGVNAFLVYLRARWDTECQTECTQKPSSRGRYHDLMLVAAQEWKAMSHEQQNAWFLRAHALGEQKDVVPDAHAGDTPHGEPDIDAPA